MFASSSCKLQRPGIKVRRDSDRASISPSDSIRPVADPDLQMGGGGGVGLGHPDSEIKGGPGLKKKFFSALRASFWSKTKGAPDSPAPPLVTPLKTTGDSARQRRIKKKMFQNLKYHFFCVAFLSMQIPVVGSLPLLYWGPGRSCISWSLL